MSDLISTQLSFCLPLSSYGIQCHLLLGFEESFPRKGLAHQGLKLSGQHPRALHQYNALAAKSKITSISFVQMSLKHDSLKLDTTMVIQCIYHLRFYLGHPMKYYLGYHLLQRLLRVQSGSPSHPDSPKLGWAIWLLKVRCY